jgi:hypothetical protein
MNERTWRTSSYSGGQGNCVEVGTGRRTVAVRDSTDPAGPRLAFGPVAWRAFTARLKTGSGRSLPSGRD